VDITSPPLLNRTTESRRFTSALAQAGQDTAVALVGRYRSNSRLQAAQRYS
jgi:hypothetical protein